MLRAADWLWLSGKILDAFCNILLLVVWEKALMPSSPTRARPTLLSSPTRGNVASRPSSVVRDKSGSRSTMRPRPSSPRKMGNRGGGEREKVVGLLRRTGRQTPEMPDFVHGRLKHYGPGKVTVLMIVHGKVQWCFFSKIRIKRRPNDNPGDKGSCFCLFF